MTELLSLLLLGIVLLVLFVLALLKGQSEEAASLDMARLAKVVPLPGLSFRSPELLFRDDDYAWLRSNRALRGVARLHRRDRRRMVLLWLRLLQADLFVLWRVRRMLAGFGASANVVEEFLFFLKAVVVLSLLLFLRVCVWLTGPFAVMALLRGCRTLVESVFRSCADLLTRIPPAQWPEIEEQCTLQFRGETAA